MNRTHDKKPRYVHPTYAAMHKRVHELQEILSHLTQEYNQLANTYNQQLQHNLNQAAMLRTLVLQPDTEAAKKIREMITEITNKENTPKNEGIENTVPADADSDQHSGTGK